MHSTTCLAALLLAVCGFWPTASPADSGVTDARPQASLTAADVVRIQLQALRGNGPGDKGIEVAFRFASPDNREATGPLARFARMIKQGPYALMLSFTAAEYGPVQVMEREARQRVTLFAPGLAPVTYVFYLQRQVEAGPLKDCWLTAGVAAIPGKGRGA